MTTSKSDRPGGKNNFSAVSVARSSPLDISHVLAPRPALTGGREDRIPVLSPASDFD